MRKVSCTANRFAVIMLSVLIALCVVLGVGFFVPGTLSAVGDEVTPIETELSGLGLSDYADKLVADNVKDGTLVPFTLGGEKDDPDAEGGKRPWTCAEMAAEWTKAITKATSAKYAYVRLAQDWVAQAPAEGEMPVFGSGTGFIIDAKVGLGGLYIAAKKVILDLNGCIIDRNLKDTEYKGIAIYVMSGAGDLVIVDSDPDKAHEGKRTVDDPNAQSWEDKTIEVDKYSYKKLKDDNSGQYEYKSITGGIITGGRAVGIDGEPQNGGGIRVYRSSLHIFGGTVFGNEAINGGGVQFNNDQTINQGEFVLNGGSIIDNTAKVGGGIYAVNESKIIIKSGNIFDNTANQSGGAIHSSAAVDVQGGSIRYNNANQGGGIYLDAQVSAGKTTSADLTVNGGEIAYNNGFMGGGIYATSGTNNNTIYVTVNGGEINYNKATLGGAMYLLTGVRLSGGEIRRNNAGGYWSDNGSGLYFHDKNDDINYKLELAGPVILTENGEESSSDPKFSVYSNLRGNVKVSIAGDLATGSGADKKVADIYMSSDFCPIPGYDANGYNRDESGNLIEPGTYLHFTYSVPDPGNVTLETQGIMYSMPFTTEYFGSTDGSNYNVPISLENASYGTRFDYGANGKNGINVKIKSGDVSDPQNSDVYFIRYIYSEQNEYASADELTKFDEDDSYGNKLVKDVGIYIGEGRVYKANSWSYDTITIRVIVRPKSLESRDTEGSAANDVKITYDNADKAFTGAEVKPNVTSVSIDTGDADNPWFETPTYDVEYENNIHVAGTHYVVVKGKGNYGGAVKLPFNILQHAANTYNMDNDAIWQFYNGSAWENLTSSSKFTYNDEDQKFNVRAIVKSKFEDNSVYTSYVYALGAKQADYKLASGDTILVDPGLKLVFSKDSVDHDELFNAGDYGVKIVEVDAANGLIGDFKLPGTTINSAVSMTPFAITEAEMAAAAAEKDVSMLVVDAADGYLSFLGDVTYIENNIIKTGAVPFGYVLYNGGDITIALNPDYNIDLTIFKRAFANYIDGEPVLSHSVSTLKGAVNTVTEVTTTVTYTLNGNFSYKSDNTVTLNKKWYIVTKSNQVTLDDTQDLVHGTTGAISLPTQEVESNDIIVTVVKGNSAVLKAVKASDGKLYEYSSSAPNYRGAAISGTLREYVDARVFAAGIGTYTITAEAPEYVSAVEGENGAIYYAAPVSKNFTVTVRSIEQGGVAITVDDSALVYDETAKQAAVTLTFNGYTLVKDTDYTLNYADNIHAGDAAKVTIVGKGNYAGTVEKKFSIAVATDNVWTTSLNIASWVTGKFNRNISVVKGEAKYGNANITFGITPSEEAAAKLSAEDIAALKTVTVENGKFVSEIEELLNRLPVGVYTLNAVMAASSDYNKVDAAFEFNVLAEQYNAPVLNSITEGNLQNTVYSGNLLSMSIKNYDAASMKVTAGNGAAFYGGVLYATNAGTYTITISLVSEECTWTDGTKEDKTLNWVISPRVVKAPTPDSKKFMVTGNVQSYMPTGFDPDLMRIENNERSEAGDTYVTVYLKDTANYVWDDGTNGARVFSWTIESANWIFYTVIAVIGGVVLIMLLSALGQFLKHRARMKDLAEAEAEAKGNVGGNE